ncbi:MAG: tripartite tricarboxylate transporter substrate binding protein [Ramlibacter sp.]
MHAYAGGVVDNIARKLAPPLGEALGASVLVDSRPGADGIIAAQAVARAPADGSVLFLATGTALSYLPAVKKSLPFEPLVDFTPIARVAEVAFFLYVNADLPVRNVAQLVEYAKSRPEGLANGNGTSSALLYSSLFAKANGISLVHVPFKGESQMAPDLATGRIQMSFSSGNAMALVQSGKVRVLMTTLPERSPLAPDAPTWKESRLPPLDFSPWVGLVGPARLPKPFVDRASKAVGDALAASDLREGFAKVALLPRYADATEFASILREQLPAWKEAVRVAGVMPE